MIVRTYLVLNWDRHKKSSSVEESCASWDSKLSPSSISIPWKRESMRPRSFPRHPLLSMICQNAMMLKSQNPSAMLLRTGDTSRSLSTVSLLKYCGESRRRLTGSSGCQLMRRRGTQRSLHLLTMWGLSPALTLRLKRLWNGRISLARFTFPKKKLLLCGLLFANKQATLLIDHTNSQKTCTLLYHACVDPLICL